MRCKQNILKYILKFTDIFCLPKISSTCTNPVWTQIQFSLNPDSDSILSSLFVTDHFPLSTSTIFAQIWKAAGIVLSSISNASSQKYCIGWFPSHQLGTDAPQHSQGRQLCKSTTVVMRPKTYFPMKQVERHSGKKRNIYMERPKIQLVFIPPKYPLKGSIILSEAVW